MKKSNKPRYFKKTQSKDVVGKTSGKPREKTVAKKKELPSNSRPITEIITDWATWVERSLLLKGRLWITFMISFLLLMMIVVVSVSFYKNIRIKQNVDREREKNTKDILYWQGIANKYKGYRDAYFQLAVLEYKIGDMEKSKQYLKKVFELDPNFEVGIRLEKVLGNGNYK